MYLVHLTNLLWWLLDRSPSQRAMGSIVALLERALPFAAASMHVLGVPRLIVAADALEREALLGDVPRDDVGNGARPPRRANAARGLLRHR